MSRRISVIGSGNWGSVVANIIAKNVLEMPGIDDKVKMWVYPEQVGGESLIDVINTRHENVKYLPGVSLFENIEADADIVACTKDADFLAFVVPHQFVNGLCAQMKPHLKKGAVAVSFIKGIFCSAERIELISERITQALEIPTCVVSGANVANEVAALKFAEATLGFDCQKVSTETVLELQRLFSLPSFRVTPINDVAGIEISGALKNVIALGAGFIDGLAYGSNTKASILRIGMMEIINFAMEFFKGIRTDTFWESSGFADLVTTCYAGRNRKCAEEFVKTGESFEELEKRMLGGQKLQGPSTCEEVYAFLKHRGRLGGYPLMAQIYRISFGEDGQKAAPRSLVDICMDSALPSVKMCAKK